MSPAGGFDRYGKRRRVVGGIEARTKRGSIGRTWWSKELVAAMEQVADKGRLARGRTYARSGQVVSMRLEPGAAVGEVQGSQLRPFTSTVTIRTLDEDAVADLIDRVRSAPGMLVRLAGGCAAGGAGSAAAPAACR